MAENDDEVFDPDSVPRAISAVGLKRVTDGYELPPHRHRHAQLMLALRGMITCDVANGLWMVPPHCALWIPGGLEHSIRAVGWLELYALYIDPDRVARLPADCCAIAINPLLRELIVRASQLPRLYDEHGPAAALIQLMLDELSAAPVERLHLPLPSDPRLRRIVDRLTADPSDRATIADWAKHVAMSERSLCRLVSRQTGMSFGRWRQQFDIVLALERLGQGESVTSVALDLGYDSASAFITMFRKALGQPPAKYLAARRGQFGKIS